MQSTVELLLTDEPPPPNAAAHRFGGAPLVPVGGAQEWPTCAACQGAMQFLGQIRLGGERLLLLFMCQNDPGMCDEWDPDAGGNAARIVSTAAPLELLSPPAAGEHTLGGIWGARQETVSIATEDVEEFMTAYDVARDRRPGRAVLGQIGGEPAWIQGEETPSCARCDAPMTLAVQLEEGPDHRTAMNFGGGGVAFAFECKCGQAKLLWQS